MKKGNGSNKGYTRELKPLLESLAVPDLTISLGTTLNANSRKIVDDYNANTRPEIANAMGFIAPDLKVIADEHLPANGYSISVRLRKVTTGKIPKGKSRLEAFALLQDIIAHEIVYRADEFLSRQMLQEMLGQVRLTNPVVVDELLSGKLSLGTIRGILQRLLRERISIRDLATILENLADLVHHHSDALSLAEALRQSIGSQLCASVADSTGMIAVITLDPIVEMVMRESIVVKETGSVLALNPVISHQIVTHLHEKLNELENRSGPIVLLCNPLIRYHVRAITEHNFPQLSVLSYSEIMPGYKLTSLGHISLEGVLFMRPDKDGVWPVTTMRPKTVRGE